MSRKVKAAAIQMRCSNNVGDNIKKADEMTREAVKKGANIILLPELFERQYFCQERRYEYYAYAKSVQENDAVQHFTQTAKELGVVIIVSFYEKNINVLYNTVTVIDADGSNLGIYRKTHIPDDHYYQEKFYFSSRTLLHSEDSGRYHLRVIHHYAVPRFQVLQHIVKFLLFY